MPDGQQIKNNRNRPHRLCQWRNTLPITPYFFLKTNITYLLCRRLLDFLELIPICESVILLGVHMG